MPPFGNLYDVPVYVDARLSEHAEIAFNAGSHTDLVRMPYAEFEQLAKPEPLWLAHVMLGWDWGFGIGDLEGPAAHAFPLFQLHKIGRSPGRRRVGQSGEI